MSNPVIKSKDGQIQEVRYLDASEHVDSYYNYSAYLQKLADLYSDKWEASYKKWLAENNEELDDAK